LRDRKEDAEKRVEDAEIKVGIVGHELSEYHRKVKDLETLLEIQSEKEKAWQDGNSGDNATMITVLEKVWTTLALTETRDRHPYEETYQSLTLCPKLEGTFYA